jgi:hypothetical protein
MLGGVQGTPPHRATGLGYEKTVRQHRFEADGNFAKLSGLKPTLFCCQSQFPARVLEWLDLAPERQRKGSWKKAWGVLGEKECGIGGA